MVVAGRTVPFGRDLLFRAAGPSGFTFHVEICEDFWVATPPSTLGALAGAEILLNLSASNVVVDGALDSTVSGPVTATGYVDIASAAALDVTPSEAWDAFRESISRQLDDDAATAACELAGSRPS